MDSPPLVSTRRVLSGDENNEFGWLSLASEHPSGVHRQVLFLIYRRRQVPNRVQSHCDRRSDILCASSFL